MNQPEQQGTARNDADGDKKETEPLKLKLPADNPLSLLLNRRIEQNNQTEDQQVGTVL